MKPLNLNTLDTRRTLQHGDDIHVVRPITPRVLYMVDEGDNASGIERFRHYVAAVHALVPTLSVEVIEDLEPARLLDIVALATREVEAVEEAAGAPKAASPVATSGDAAT